MPVIACGYLVEQEYMKPFFLSDGQKNIESVFLVHKVNSWHRNLAPERKAEVPPVKLLVRNVNEGYKSGVFLVLCRIINVETEMEADKELVELESDRLKKKIFVEAFGRGFQESGMAFFVTPWKLYR